MMFCRAGVTIPLLRQALGKAPVQVLRAAFSKQVQKGVEQTLRNANLRFPVMRVLYQNEEGKTEWKIMERAEALNFTKERGLDLICVNAKADPPVCKAEVFDDFVDVAKEKEKTRKSKEKARQLKEMFVTAGIQQRDFSMKMKKVTDFLRKGHPVKVSIIPKKFLKNDRKDKHGVRKDRMQGFDATVLMLMEAVEGMQVITTELKVKGQKQPYVKGGPLASPAVNKATVADSSESSDSDEEEEEEEEVEDSESADSDVELEPESESELESIPAGKHDDSDSDLVLGAKDNVPVDVEESSDGKELNRSKGNYLGQQALASREFLITPKASMIVKSDKHDKKEKRRDRRERDDSDE